MLLLPHAAVSWVLGSQKQALSAPILSWGFSSQWSMEIQDVGRKISKEGSQSVQWQYYGGQNGPLGTTEEEVKETALRMSVACDGGGERTVSAEAQRQDVSNEQPGSQRGDCKSHAEQMRASGWEQEQGLSENWLFQ